MFNAFYSDPHFGHKNIIKHCNRPFVDVDQMNEELILRYNEVISQNDIVMWLGDCAFCKPSKFKTIMSRLHGKKCLVRGNHDRNNAIMLDMGFEFVCDETFMQISGKICRLKHYPYINGEPEGARKDDRYANLRPPKIPGEILIHGHTHAKTRVFQNMVHVGVDAWNYAPAMMADVENIITNI